MMDFMLLLPYKPQNMSRLMYETWYKVADSNPQQIVKMF